MLLPTKLTFAPDPDLGSKDAKQHVRGVWIIEMAEIAELHRSKVESVKAFISTESDRYRRSGVWHFSRLVSRCSCPDSG
jgi:predicted P-loop ATPase